MQKKKKFKYHIDSYIGYYKMQVGWNLFLMMLIFIKVGTSRLKQCLNQTFEKCKL